MEPRENEILNQRANIQTSPRGPFYEHRLNSIPTWISYYMHRRVWNEMTDPFPNINDAIVEVCERISNFIPHFIVGVFTYPYQD